jgi:hypothetical protein
VTVRRSRVRRAATASAAITVGLLSWGVLGLGFAVAAPSTLPRVGSVAPTPSGPPPLFTTTQPIVFPTVTGSPTGTPVCTITDPRVRDLSGLVATPTGFIVINDIQFDSAKMEIFYLDQHCGVVKTVAYPTPARDPQDLAVAPDGSLWVADIGDVHRTRTTVALWHLSSGGGAPVIYRMSYPDGAHDAQALFFTPAGVPLLITFNITGAAGLYEPTAPLVANTAAGVAMRKVGEFSAPRTYVPNALGPFGEVLVTGAAVSPDRHMFTIRTYSTAFEWDVPADGDVVHAITTQKPRITPLPYEPEGDAITYTMDGSRLLTLSDQDDPTTIRSYPREQPTPDPMPVANALHPMQPSVSAALVILLAGVTGVGIIVAVVGMFGLRRSRRAE